MKSVIFPVILLLLCIQSYSQISIKPEESSSHVGDSVTVCSKVYSARYLENVKNAPTLLNLGGAYPNQLLTIVIWSDLRAKLDGKPEEIFINKNICVTGKIELYKEKPQIVIRSKEQVKTE